MPIKQKPLNTNFLDFSLSDDKDSQVKFMTGKDRFASMAKKNPNLHSFKSIFNLDIEF